MVTRPPPPLPGGRSWAPPQPRRRSTSLMIETSRMSGTSSSVVRPGASSAAAISFSALFFAPVLRTRPPRGEAPPRHELRGAVFRAGDPDAPAEGRPAGHLEAVHRVTLRWAL